MFLHCSDFVQLNILFLEHLKMNRVMKNRLGSLPVPWPTFNNKLMRISESACLLTCKKEIIQNFSYQPIAFDLLQKGVEKGKREGGGMKKT